MRKHVRAQSIDPLVEEEMKTRPNITSHHPSFPTGVYHAAAAATNGQRHQQAYDSQESYIMSQRISEDIQEEMALMSEHQELLRLPQRFRGRTETFSHVHRRSENNALKNILYGTTAAGFGYCPEEPLGKDFSNDYAASKHAQD